jgi:hypothetical protein
MGLFDAVREKAAELLSGASDKVSELTGADLGEAQQNVTDTTQNLGDTAQGHVDTATGSVTDSVADATQNPAEHLPEDPRGRE